MMVHRGTVMTMPVIVMVLAMMAAAATRMRPLGRTCTLGEGRRRIREAATIIATTRAWTTDVLPV